MDAQEIIALIIVLSTACVMGVRMVRQWRSRVTGIGGCSGCTSCGSDQKGPQSVASVGNSQLLQIGGISVGGKHK